MAGILITPWREASELFVVRRQLFLLGECKATNDRRRAIDTITAWKVRGNLPFSIEASALLVEAILHHGEGSLGPLALRAMYTSAVCRFVTIFCDDPQERRRMNSIAHDIGMPMSFVDFRNEATHGEMPALSVVANTAQNALSWLWKHYWVKLDDNSAGIVADSADMAKPSLADIHSNASAEKAATFHDDLLGLLQDYRESRLRELLQIEKNNQETEKQRDLHEKEQADETCKACVRLCRGQEQKLRALAELLISKNRLLVPKDPVDDSTLSAAHRLWDPLLLRLVNHQHRFLGVMLALLSMRLVEPSHLDVKCDSLRRVLHSWLRHIFLHPRWNRSRSSAHKETDGIRETTQGPTSSLRAMVVSDCLTNPMYWSWKLARELIETADVKFRYDWVPVYNGSLPDTPSGEIATAGDATVLEGQVRSSMPEHNDRTILRLTPPSADEASELTATASADSSQEATSSTGNGGLEQPSTQQQASSRGWKKWTGAWRPKPIGVVDA